MFMTSLIDFIAFPWANNACLALQIVFVLLWKFSWIYVRRKAFNQGGLPYCPEEARKILGTVNWGKVLFLRKPNGKFISAILAEKENATHLIIYSHGNGGECREPQAAFTHIISNCRL
jgi:hypothetical protein